MVLSTRQSSYPLQTDIQQMTVTLDYSTMSVEQIAQAMKLNNLSLDAAKIFIAMIPVLIVYPFLQRYFVDGITLGSVKRIKKEEEYMKRKQVIAFVSAAALAVTSLAGCGKTEEKTEKTTVSEAEETAKEDLPLSKYPETVTVHLGGSMNPNAKIPDGMTMMIMYTGFIKGRP